MDLWFIDQRSIGSNPITALEHWFSFLLTNQTKGTIMLGLNEIKNRFGFHKGTIEGPNATAPQHADLRTEFINFADSLDECLPDGRSKSLSMTALEEASMWAHKAIAETAPLVSE